MATFQERINTLYEEAKDDNHRLTQTDYAARFEATRNQLKGWLDGRGEPNSEMMKKIAKIHAVSVSWLVGETNIRRLRPLSSPYPGASVLETLPPEAIRSIEEYIEFLRLKYCQ